MHEKLFGKVMTINPNFRKTQLSFMVFKTNEFNGIINICIKNSSCFFLLWF